MYLVAGLPFGVAVLLVAVVGHRWGTAAAVCASVAVWLGFVGLLLAIYGELPQSLRQAGVILLSALVFLAIPIVAMFLAFRWQWTKGRLIVGLLAGLVMLPAVPVLLLISGCAYDTMNCP